jgi:gliding motility-associated-like protein
MNYLHRIRTFIPKLLTGLILSAFCVCTAQAQLSVTNGSNLGLTPLQLVQQVLVGTGVTVSNATFNGNAGVINSNMLGTFTATGIAQTQLGFGGGVILTSGEASIAVGPNNSGSAGVDVGSGSDPDLAMLIPGYTVHDRAVLQFDFVPIADTVKFRYVFGSEEFFEWCNSSYNDVFGFFISGPGITGPFTNSAINIALMPNSTQYVTINNLCGSSYIINNNAGQYLQYDGYTVVLTAWVIVQPCQTYRIKLAVGDAGDGVYDSGVFFEQNSFSSNGISYNTQYSSNIDTVAVEGCNNAIVSFVLNQPAQTPIVIHYTIGGTAIMGLDYHPVPDSLILLPGMDSVSFSIIPIADGIPEPWETVIISYINTVCGTLDTILIWIKDYDSIVTTVTPDVYICNGAPANIACVGSMGYPPLNYIWNTGQQTQGITVQPGLPTMYYVSVSDACNFATVDSVLVSISNLSSQITNIDSVSCHNYTDGSITVSQFDGLPPFTYNWSSGDTSATIQNLSSGNYIVTVTDGIGCTSVNGVTLTNPVLLQMQLTATDENCLNSCNGQLQSAILANPQPPYSYAWSTSPAQNTPTATGLCAGMYTLTLTYSPSNCTITATEVVSTSTILDMNFTANPNQGFVPLDVEFTSWISCTGNCGLSYFWDFGDGNTSTALNPTHTYEEMGTYTATLTVNSGPPDNCEDVYQTIITVVRPSKIDVFNVFTPNGDGANDFFSVNSEGVRSFKIVIFNRWGKKVHETEVSDGFSDRFGKVELWDGRNMNGGAMCATGTYFYIIEAVGYDTKTYSLNGTLQLLR